MSANGLIYCWESKPFPFIATICCISDPTYRWGLLFIIRTGIWTSSILSVLHRHCKWSSICMNLHTLHMQEDIMSEWGGIRCSQVKCQGALVLHSEWVCISWINTSLPNRWEDLEESDLWLLVFLTQGCFSILTSPIFVLLPDKIWFQFL